ncbi:DUF6477 family protein [Aestuariibius insulae]|uniref:DUF6477 family protein n=1 Tax=Aestuariibius insulae TaxID=2058287 RepID=UPI00345E9699
MLDILTMIRGLKRPALIVRAARCGVDCYARNIDLRRLLGVDVVPSPGEALMDLMEIERDLNDLRRGADASYGVAAHVDVLIAIMGEARLLQGSAEG